jgi:hypothetical protein
MLTYDITHPVNTGRPHIAILNGSPPKPGGLSSEINLRAKSARPIVYRPRNNLQIYAQKSSGFPGNSNKESLSFVI